MCKRKVELKTESGGSIIVEGEVYRDHWLIHDCLLKPEAEHSLKGAVSLSHINSGLGVKSAYSKDGLKRLADIIIDDIGVDGSFECVNDLSEKQKRAIAHQRSVEDYTNYVGSILH
jgi:hypothetical protein